MGKAVIANAEMKQPPGKPAESSEQNSEPRGKIDNREQLLEQTREFYEQQLRTLEMRREKHANDVSAFEREKRKWKKTEEAYETRKRELRDLRKGAEKRLTELRVEKERAEEIIRRASKESGISAPLEELQRCIQRLDARTAELTKSNRQNEAEAQRLERLEASINVRLSAIEAREAKMASLSKRLKTVRAELRATKTEVDDLGRQLRSEKRRSSKVAKKHDALLARSADIQHWIAGLDWAVGNGGTEYDVLGPDIVLVGSGPYDYSEMYGFFEARGINVWAADSEDVPVMVVGTNDWSEEELEMQIAAQQGQELRVYSQELALLSLTSGTDILQTAPETELLALATNHSALEFLIEAELMWPSTTVLSIPREFRPFAISEGVDESPLKSLGYTVGITVGLPAGTRKEILKKAFLNELPFVHSEDYMRDWGRPGTRRRLWRIAHHLRWIANSRKYLPNHQYAVRDWKDDLDMLEKRFFKPWMRFAWPRLEVPGKRR